MTTEIISFGNAMVAYENHKKVQWWYIDEWCDFRGEENVANLINTRWRIKPEPVKYSVDVWLDRAPESGCADSLEQYLIGDEAGWCEHVYEEYNKHYRITVEEVKE